MLGVGAARRPGVKVDHGEVRGPHDLRHLGDAKLVGVAAGRERHPGRLDPLGTLLGNALLVDLLALDPVGKAAELRRPLAQGTHDALADGEVVADEIPLRVARRREQHLVGVRHLDETFPDLDLDERRGHCLTVSGAMPSITIESKVMLGSVVRSPRFEDPTEEISPCAQRSLQALPS